LAISSTKRNKKSPINKRQLQWVVVFLSVFLFPVLLYGSLLVLKSLAVPIWALLIAVSCVIILFHRNLKTSPQSPVLGFLKISLFIAIGCVVFGLVNFGIYVALFSLHGMSFIVLALISAAGATLSLYIPNLLSRKSAN